MRSTEFLQKFHPDVPWVLTSIAADRKGIETRAFEPGDPEASVWAANWDGNRNCYFSVNEVIDPESKKASKENIKAVHWLHVDIDARAGHDRIEELDRIKRLVTTELPEGVPKPTCVVFSGGGYQCFWKLEEPIPVYGKEAAWKEAERYNRQLELLFKADSCHNVDRIMRLPGTMNIPNAQKVAKGRVPVRAEVLYFDKTRHSLASFSQAVETAAPGRDADVQISGNIQRLDSIDDLDQWKVPDRVKVVCVQGFHPDEPKEGDNSRSAWVFDAVCNMVRSNVPDDVIYSVITDQGFKISESVREASDPDRYAKKQIRSAKEAVESDWLYRLNERYAVIGNIGGKCRVIEEVIDPVLKRPRLVKQSFEDFRNRYMNEFEMVAEGDKVKQVPVGQWWLRHPRRRQYDRIVFAPGHTVPEAYNLWRGFACPALPGKLHQSFLDHIHEVLCRGDDELYEYLIGWLARMVQDPAQEGHTAVVLRGRQGTGKSFFAKMVGELFGRHFLHISNGTHLTGQFNGHLRDVVLLFADEAFYAGDRRHESVLKTLITEPTLMIEVKGVDAEVAPNFVHLIMASNADWVVPADLDDRRFFVLDVSKAHAGDRVYFAGIHDDLKAGGFQSLLYFLMNYDLSNYNVNMVPKTQALTEQKMMSMGPERVWWYQVLADGRFGDHGPTLNGQPTLMTANELYNYYTESCVHVANHRILSKLQLSHFIRRVCPSVVSKRKVVDGQQQRVTIIPPLEQARVDWETEMRMNGDWEPVEAEEEENDLPF
jgi:hypothetical protein